MNREASEGNPNRENPEGISSFYRRRLPHWQPQGAVIFVTYRLADSLPPDVLTRLRQERSRLLKSPLRRGENPRARALRLGKQIFALLDEALADELRLPTTGPTQSARWLSDPRIAEIVRENLRHWQGRRYHLHRYVIMPNHAHILVEPLKVAQAVSLCNSGSPQGNPSRQGSLPEDERCYALSQILQNLKGYTSRRANQLLGRCGTFWQDESYDHWVRDEAEYARIVDYIDQNPVKAGLCAAPGQWRWSSAADVAQAVGL